MIIISSDVYAVLSPITISWNVISHVIDQLVISCDLQKAGDYIAQIGDAQLCNVLITFETQFSMNFVFFCVL